MVRTMTNKKLTLEQIFAAAIKQTKDQRVVIEPKTIAQMPQNSKVAMALDEEGNFVLTVRDNING